ncbi:hypothetical protein L208DRAFT_1334068 [Tricholoma matsutake]|nr:hypothetical protein L208DRAFT_1334068 [Tricholoma matsutake 945]
MSLILQIHSIAKIVPTMSVPELVKKREPGEWLKKEDIKLSSLPLDLEMGFRSKFIPHLCDLVGTIRPWEQPTEDQVIIIWNKVITDHSIANDAKLKKVVVTLVEAQLASWQNTFATAAHTNLKKLFKALGLNSTEKRAEYVVWALGDNDKYGKETNCKCLLDAATSAHLRLFKGVFQSSLIIHTFATHLASISLVPPSDHQQELPVGALIYSIQAVHIEHHHLTCI